MSDRNFRAFISYSHRDEQWGTWLHRRLERYRVPTALIGRNTGIGPVPKRLYPIFRDREELPTAADLGTIIEEALQQSSFLIVICSPRSAASQWVDAEIRRFKQIGRADHVLALIVDGQPNASDSANPVDHQRECFPRALRYAVTDDGTITEVRCEPMAADARPDKDGKHNAFLKLAAGLLGVGYDELRRREERRQRQRLIAGLFAALLMVSALTSLTIWALISRQQAIDSERLARSAQQQAIASEQLALKAKQEALDSEQQAITAKQHAEAAEQEAIAQRDAADTARAAEASARKAEEQAKNEAVQQRDAAIAAREAEAQARQEAVRQANAARARLAELTYRQGRKALESGNPAQAIEAINKARELQLTSPDADFHAFRAQQQLGGRLHDIRMGGTLAERLWWIGDDRLVVRQTGRISVYDLPNETPVHITLSHHRGRPIATHAKRIFAILPDGRCQVTSPADVATWDNHPFQKELANEWQRLEYDVSADGTTLVIWSGLFKGPLRISYGDDGFTASYLPKPEGLAFTMKAFLDDGLETIVYAPAHKPWRLVRLGDGAELWSGSVQADDQLPLYGDDHVVAWDTTDTIVLLDRTTGRVLARRKADDVRYDQTTGTIWILEPGGEQATSWSWSSEQNDLIRLGSHQADNPLRLTEVYEDGCLFWGIGNGYQLVSPDAAVLTPVLPTGSQGTRRIGDLAISHDPFGAGSVKMYNIHTGLLRGHIVAHPSIKTILARNKSGTSLALFGSDGRLSVWAVEEIPAPAFTHIDPLAPLGCISYADANLDPTGQRFAISSAHLPESYGESSTDLRIYNHQGQPCGRLPWTGPRQGGAAGSLSWSNDGQFLLGLDSSGASLWRVADQPTLLHRFNNAALARLAPAGTAAIIAQPATAGIDFQYLDLASGDRHPLEHSISNLRGFVCSPGGGRTLALDGTTRAELIDITDGQRWRFAHGLGQPQQGLVHHRRDCLALADANGRLAVIDPEKQTITHVHLGSAATTIIEGLDDAPIIVGTVDGTISAWAPGNDQPRWQLNQRDAVGRKQAATPQVMKIPTPSPHHLIEAICLSLDRRYLVATNSDPALGVTIWSMTTHEPLESWPLTGLRVPGFIGLGHVPARLHPTPAGVRWSHGGRYISITLPSAGK